MIQICTFEIKQYPPYGAINHYVTNKRYDKVVNQKMMDLKCEKWKCIVEDLLKKKMGQKIMYNKPRKSCLV